MTPRTSEQINTEHIRIPIVGEYTTRVAASNKDQRFVNCYVENVENKPTEIKTFFLRKRPGILEHLTVKTTGSLIGRGFFYWPKTGKFYSAIDNKVYADTTEIATLTTSTGHVSFERSTGGTEFLVMQDGSKVYTISPTDVVTQRTIPWTGTMVPGIGYLDGYNTVVLTTGEMYNSNLEDPTTWQATSFVSAEMMPDNAVSHIRYINNLVVLGEHSTEFFFDAANTPGSPFEVNQSVDQQIGCIAGRSVAKFENGFFWVGRTAEGMPSVFYSYDYKVEDVANYTVRRALSAEGANIANAIGATFKIDGHKFYMISLSATSFVYDIEHKMWYEWTWNNGTTQTKMPVAAVAEKDGVIYFLSAVNGKIYRFDQNATKDQTSLIRVLFQSGQIDFSTNHRKSCYKMYIIGDNSSSTLNVRWSDDDYTTFSDIRQVDLSKIDKRITRLGMFRRRGFEITHEADAPLRLEAFDFYVKRRFG